MSLKAFIFLGLFLSAAFVFYSTTAAAESSQLDQTKSDAVEETTDQVEDAKSNIRGCEKRCCSRFRGCWCCSASEADQLAGPQVKTHDNNVEEHTNDGVEDAKYYKCKQRCCHPYKGCWCCSAAEAHQAMQGSYSDAGNAGKGEAENEDHPKQIEN